MFKAKVDVKFSAEEVAQKFEASLSGANGIQAMFANKVAMDTNPFVPMDQGTLAASVIRASNFEEGNIVYDTPYAKRLYYGDDLNFNSAYHSDGKRKAKPGSPPHPQATHHWFEAAKSRFIDAWGEFAAKLLGGTWRRTS